MKRRCSIAVLSCCLSGSAIALHAQPAPATQSAAARNGSEAAGNAPLSPVNEAKRDIAHGQFDAAIALLLPLTTNQGDTPDAFHELGLAYYRKGDLARASAAFARAIQANPGDRESTQLRGLALYRLGHPAEAIPLLEQVRRWMPGTDSDVNYVLGLCYMDAAHYDEARAAFARQYGINPEGAPAYLLAGKLFLRAHLEPAAEAAGSKASERDAHLAGVHLLLGEIALAREQVDKAVEEFQAELRISPASARVYDRLGDAYTRQGRYADARAALNQSVILDPQSTGPYIQLGKVLLRQHDPATAAMYLQRAIAMDPRNYITHALLGQALRALGRNVEADQESKEAEQLQDAGQPKLENLH
jgi:tetratricopeptide (TPR) repeat protein